jgi:HNH endonuclease
MTNYNALPAATQQKKESLPKKRLTAAEICKPRRETQNSSFRHITHEELINLLDYDPETGILTCRVKRGRMLPGMRAGYVTNHGERRHIRLKGRVYMEYRIVWFHYHGYMPDKFIDHINGNACDNRIFNLRLADTVDNTRNRRLHKNNKTGFKGVTLSGKKNVPFHAAISINKRLVHLGNFATSEEAHSAYCEQARKHFGDFANFGGGSE